MTRKIKISAKMARLPFNGCDPDYIANVCHARCCESSTAPTGTVITIHPTEVSKIEARGGIVLDGLLQPKQGQKKCPFKTSANLCGLHQTPDKPFGCIASPFTLNKNGTLIVRNRYKMLKCYNDGNKIPAYKAFAASLNLILGAEQAQRVTAHFDNGGGDIMATIQDGVYSMLVDNDDIKHKALEGIKNTAETSGTSIFDPVLCELAYTWFTPKGAAILDPFAGGSVRGIVANYLGRHYTGIDLRPEQIAANVEQGAEIVPTNQPRWLVGDSLQMDSLLDDGERFDFVFSCPPYADLEVYSDDPLDISTMGYDDFLTAYRGIIKQAVSRLHDNRFACFVVGEVRDKRGNYRNFVGDTVEAFKAAGCEFYNEAILVTSAGSLPIRAGRQFEAGRKLGKTHQNILVFVKGDGKKATEFCGDVEVFGFTEADHDG